MLNCLGAVSFGESQVNCPPLLKSLEQKQKLSNYSAAGRLLGKLEVRSKSLEKVLPEFRAAHFNPHRTKQVN